ncbi:MAG: elongation factor P [Deltaproteobacteria bacterium]|nr:MAG: elongation factor P [Deltaproteobacteria bacterium]
MIDTADFRRGKKIELDGEVYEIVDFQHARTAQRRAFVRTKLKSIATGAVQERTFSAGEKIAQPEFEERRMQFLYQEGEQYNFMDNKTYEQITLSGEQVGESKKFLQENIELVIQFFNSRPIGLILPITVEFEVVETDPGFKGDTATGGSKPARISTGATVNVPLFVNTGDKIKIDTRTGEYIERVK